MIKETIEIAETPPPQKKIRMANLAVAWVDRDGPDEQIKRLLKVHVLTRHHPCVVGGRRVVNA